MWASKPVVRHDSANQFLQYKISLLQFTLLQQRACFSFILELPYYMSTRDTARGKITKTIGKLREQENIKIINLLKKVPLKEKCEKTPKKQTHYNNYSNIDEILTVG